MREHLPSRAGQRFVNGPRGGRGDLSSTGRAAFPQVFIPIAGGARDDRQHRLHVAASGSHGAMYGRFLQ